jgi:hypothetical protein
MCAQLLSLCPAVSGRYESTAVADEEMKGHMTANYRRPRNLRKRPKVAAKLLKTNCIMNINVCAPRLSRVRSWPLIALGISGWLALYSVAILAWGTGANLIGNAQGGCFAATMTLASLQANRQRKMGAKPADPLEWLGGVSTEQLNQMLAQTMAKQEFRVEACHRIEREMGFGVRAINAGRTIVFETARWQEPVIDLDHAQTTEANRKRVLADLAIIVGIGKADLAAQTFAKTCPIKLLVGNELNALVVPEKSAVENPAAKNV